MSRNFELLQSAGKAIDAFVPEDQGPSVQLTAVVETAGPQVQGAERDEIARMISRIFLSDSEMPRCVAFMGAEAGTGCSRVCAQASEVLASTIGDGSVCVLDANLRNPSLHEHFGVENRYGLTDAVQDGGSIRKYVQFLSKRKLALLTCGPSVGAWQTLLASQQMHARLAELRREFQYVLVDIPPLNLYPDGVTLAKASDGLVLVLKANSTRREVAQAIVQDLKSASVRVLGAILNERHFPIPEALYRRL
jgi:Mrp family chromosome partitioning ATPase